MSKSPSRVWRFGIPACIGLLLLAWPYLVPYGHRDLAGAVWKNEAASPLMQNKYSIVVSTYNRVEHLHTFLQHHANGSLPRLDAVFIAWGLGAVDPPDWLHLDAFAVPVYLERARVNSLSERFRKPSKMRTEAALFIDDDIHIPAADVELGFDAYLSFGKKDHRITGYSARQYTIDAEGTYTYRKWEPNYSIILTNSAFLDTTMLKWFWSKDARIARSLAHVDKNMNCEDILMNYVVSDRNGLSPIMVDAPDIVQITTSGISDQSGHYDARSGCLQVFSEIWGTPLRTSHIMVGESVKLRPRANKPLLPPFRKSFTPWALGKKFVAP